MLASGQALGHYIVLSPLGTGGMGEVYLAEDTGLRRRVALKVLPERATADEGSRRRLLREARAAAALDHPNICTVYEVGEADGQAFIAMQFVEGETLADRLSQGSLEPPAAIAIAAQIAAALAEAHRRGIVHRDIKPHNVMLAPSGQVKVLDFGLAQVAHPMDGQTRTQTIVTEAGMVAGTAPYMSPEQIRGEALDTRSDIFSFGCVLYEMIGGAGPFAGATAADAMSAVLTRETPPLPERVASPDLQRLVDRCLQKDRDRRYQAAGELLRDLERVDTGRVTPARTVHGGAPRARVRRRYLVTAFALVLLALAAIAAYFFLGTDRQLRLSPDDFVQLTGFPDTASAPALSPDGRMVAFIRDQEFLGTGQIYVKLLPNGDPVQLTDDPRPKYGPAFTPDGSRVAYTAVDAHTQNGSWETWTVPVLGGKATRMLPNAAGLTWIGDHQVLFSEIKPASGLHMGIVTAREDRRDQRQIYFPAESRAMAHYSYLSPDRRWVLVVEMDRTGRFQPCRIVPFDGRSTGRIVGPSGACTSAAWSPDGRWMYFSANVGGANHLYRQRFPDGAPAQLTSSPATEERGIAMAPDGRSLITSVGQSLGSLWIRDSRGERLLPLDGFAGSPRVSRDGSRVYCLVQRVGDPAYFGITVVDLASGKSDRMLGEFSIVDFDISRDDQSVAFTVAPKPQKREIWLAALDRRSPPRRVASDGDQVHFGRGKELVYRSLTGTANVLTRVSSDSGRAVRVSDRPIIELGDVSPDGDWAVVAAPSATDTGPATFAVQIHGPSIRQICSGFCPIRWLPDGNTAYMPVTYDSGTLGAIRYPLQSGQVIPDITSNSIGGARGTPPLLWDSVAAGPDPSMLVFTRAQQRGNLFRVPLR